MRVSRATWYRWRAYIPMDVIVDACRFVRENSGVYEPFYTLSDVGRLIGVSRRTVLRYAKGECRADKRLDVRWWRIGRKYVVSCVELWGRVP